MNNSKTKFLNQVQIDKKYEALDDDLRAASIKKNHFTRRVLKKASELVERFISILKQRR